MSTLLLVARLAGDRVINLSSGLPDVCHQGGYEPQRSVSAFPFEGVSEPMVVLLFVGYGNVTPRTEWGKLATILYAIIGMPLFLLYLSNIGDVLAKSFKWTYAKCFLCKGCTRREIPERHRRLKRVQHSMEIAYNESPPEPSFRSFSIREDWQVRHVIGEDDVVAIRMEQDSRGQDTEDDDSDGGEDSDDEDSDNEGLDEEYDPQTVTVPLTLCLAIMVGSVANDGSLVSIRSIANEDPLSEVRSVANDELQNKYSFAND
uniref:Potassium channel domain-containing protein n=1 Tax=Timema douglasi TaxID=61478 RepID=A0A7R8Z7E9_TIMDO|nr:unnamed protein product [Timema douglasi]